MPTLPTPDVTEDWGDDLNAAVVALTPRFDDRHDASWGSPLGYDLEFDSDQSPGSTLPAGWSWVNQGTSTWAQRFGAGVITPQTGTSETGHRMIVRALPTETTWTATASLGAVVSIAQWNRWGFVLREASSGKYTLFGFAADRMQVQNWSATGLFAAGSEVAVTAIRWGYLRVSRLSGGNYTFAHSIDGNGWRDFVANRAPYATYDQIGLLAQSPDGASFGCDWLRVR